MDQLIYKSHLYERMIDREIGWPTIEAVARSGEVIEEHQNGILKLALFGFVVVLVGNRLITAYRDSKAELNPRSKRKKPRRKEFKADWIRGRKVNVRLANYYLGMVDR